MNERALSFGADALSYHRFRPGYPEAVVDLVLDHADGMLARALEVGAGTGKATTAVAARGIEVLAVEPDDAMRAVLVEQTRGLPVRSVGATFETLDVGRVGSVDLLFAAAAFHWTDPATRWGRVAALLRPGGVAAFFGGFTVLSDPDLSARVDALAAEVLAHDTVDLGEGNDRGSVDWPASDLRRLPAFTAVVQTVVPRRSVLPAADYVSLLATVSAYAVVPAAARRDLLDRIHAVLPETVEVTQDVMVHLARRARDDVLLSG